MKASAEPRMVATSTHLRFAGGHGFAPPPEPACAHGRALGDLVMTATLTNWWDASEPGECSLYPK
jgi:hypothetical protein